MNAKDIGSLRSLFSNGRAETQSRDQGAFELLEHIEHSLVDLRHVLEVSAHEQQQHTPSEQHEIEPAENDPNGPLRIVLVAENENSPKRRTPVKLSQLIDGNTPEELRAALEQRDEYITYLCGAIREMTIRIEAWLRLLQERSLTTETAVILKDAEECVRHLVKTMEIELSIERAELGRERAQFEAEKREFEFEKERATHECSAPTEVTTETPMMQRWRRFLTVAPAPRGAPSRSGTSGSGP